MDKNDINAIQRVNSRTRTSLLHRPEMTVIEYCCRIMPRWVSSDALTFIGMVGSVMTAVSICLAVYNHNKNYLFLAVLSLAVQWFGDSLDGRIAYFRNQPRRWYGWVLDMNLDWISVSLLGLAYYFYYRSFGENYTVVALILVAINAHAYILVNMKYKISGEYLIDSGGLFGPTELRIILALATLAEVFIDKFLLGFGIVVGILMLFLNFKDLRHLLKMGNERDAKEKKENTNPSKLNAHI